MVSVRECAVCSVILSLIFPRISTDVYAFSEVFHVPWGTQPESVSYRHSHAGTFGPTDFYMETGADGERFATILDREQALLKRFTIPEGKLIEASEVPPFSELFAASGDTTVFWNGEALLIHSHSRADTVRPDYRTVRAVQRIWIDTGGIHVLDERQNTWDVETTATEQWSIRSSDVLSSVRRISPDTIIIGTENDDSIRFSCSFELGTIQYIGTLNGYHVVLAERILNPSPLDVQELLLLVSGTGSIHHEIHLPRIYFSWIPSRIHIIDNTLYLMISSPDGLFIYEFTADMAESPLKFDTSSLGNPYHYNEHLPLITEESVGGNDRDEDPMTRSQIMEIAGGYVDAQWTATSANITDGIEIMPDGSSVRTPAWVVSGQRRKVPYKWGGWTSLSVFLAGVPPGKKCGDDYTNSVSWTDLYCIGVDCSGYISRCWDTDIKYGTSTIQSISSTLSSVSELRQGDALNNAGSHIRLCAENLPSGMVLTMEASAYDWRTSYRAYRLVDLTAYTPIRFDWIIEEESPVDPFVIMVKEWRESLNVRSGPGTDESVFTTIESGQRYVAVAEHNGWYAFHIPAGTGTYMGWSYGGTSSTNGYLEGDQATRIATVTTGALNIRTGPGTGYPVITAASNGQRFAVLDSSGVWYGIQLANTPGYVSGWSSSGASGQYLDLSSGGPADGYGAYIESIFHPAEMDERETAVCSLQVMNSGSCSWDTETFLRTTLPRERQSTFFCDGWIDSSTICSLDRHVLPFQRHTIQFELCAPFSGGTSEYHEYLGFEQSGFCWFGDTGQFGPDDEGCVFTIVVENTGLPSTPILQDVKISGGSVCLEWNTVNEATLYGVFREYIGSEQEPISVVFSPDTVFMSSSGVGDPMLNPVYMIKAYVPADSSGFSPRAGEFDYDLP